MAIVVVLFTIVFPLSKYLLTVLMLLQKTSKRLYAIYAGLNKWSMLDVFVVALMILSLKLKGDFVEVESRYGLYFLTVSILLSIFMSQFLLKAVAGDEKH